LTKGCTAATEKEIGSSIQILLKNAADLNVGRELRRKIAKSAACMLTEQT